MRRLPVVVAIVLSGCRTTAPAPTNAASSAGKVVLPDSAVIEGVHTFSHAAGAFARTVQLTLDTIPIAVYDGGTKSEFDLTYVWRPMLFADGRLLASSSVGGGRLMLFDADGTPARVVAPFGEGPGSVRSPIDPIALTPDTALVIDGQNHRVNWVTSAGGIVRTAPLQATLPAFCFQDAALLRDRHLLASNGCVMQGELDKPTRTPVDVVVMGLDFSAPDTVAKIPGHAMVPFETRYRGVKRVSAIALRFGDAARVAPWESGFVSATGLGGYVLERRALDGHVFARIVVRQPPRVATSAMREAQIKHELDQIAAQGAEGMVDPDETKREARDVPFADSLPPYGFLYPAPGDVLWVGDYAARGDSTWSATAFRPDGAIVGRLTAHIKGSSPVAFGKDRVLLRWVDDDGVVRFGVFKLLATNQ